MDKGSAVKTRVFAIITMIIWSITFVSSKVLLSYFSPTDLLLLRLVLAFLCSMLMSPSFHPFMGVKTEAWCALTAFSGVGIYQIAENYALFYSPAGQVSVIVSTAPMLTVLVGVLIGKVKRPNINFHIGFIIAILGISLICFQKGVGKASFLGLGFAFLAALCWAIYSFSFEHLAKEGIEDREITKRMFFYSVLLLIPLSIVDGNSISWENLKSVEVLGNLFFLAFVAQALAFLLWNKALRGLGAVEANIYIYLVPAITAIFGYFILKEPFTVYSFIGTFLVLLGLCLSDDKIIEKIYKKRLPKIDIL